MEFPADAKWFKANINGTGFYRVNYPEQNWDALILALKRDHSAFTPADRAQLINDAFALSEYDKFTQQLIPFANVLISTNRAGFLAAVKPLEMCLYLLKETEIVPWAAALRHLSHWKVVLQETDLVGLINGFVQHIIAPIYNKVGWEDTGSHVEK